MKLTTFQRPELRDANNNIVQQGTYSVKNGVLANAQNSGILDYINNNLQAHQNAIETLQTGTLQTKIVTSLPNPSVADANTIYMIKYTSSGEEYYYQYRLIDGSFVRVGDTKIDISDLENKLDKSGGSMTGNINFAVGYGVASNRLIGVDLDTLTNEAVYWAGGGSNCANSPLPNAEGFGLEVIRTAGGYRNQVITNSTGIKYTRYHNGTSWSSWYGLKAKVPDTNDNSENVATTSYVKNNLDNYVAKSGGTVTAPLSFSYTVAVKKPVDDSYTLIYGATEYNKGAYLRLNGKDFSTDSGRASLYAHDGTTTNYISVYPDGTTYAPTPSASDNSTKIATTSFCNSACTKKLNITYSTTTNAPWLAIASVFANMTAGTEYVGYIANGSAYGYYGHKVNNNYGSFIVHQHSSGSVRHVYCNNGTWYHQLINCGTATNFTL